MQKISLKVLLRFLSRYSHWNLVRRSDCYHLYFVTKGSASIANFPSSRCKQREQRARRKATKLNREVKEVVPYARKQRKPGSTNQERKDLFVFSPIFQNPEQAVHVGLDNAVDERSKRSSFSSLIWDDFLPPYKKESDAIDTDDDERASFTSVETLTDFDSRESTPFNAGRKAKGKKSKKEEINFYETSVRKQGDKLLRDMLQLRKDIENFKEPPEDNNSANEKRFKEIESDVQTHGAEIEKNEENILRERLEQMTIQIKQELEEEMIKNESQKDKAKENDANIDPSKVKDFFQNLIHQTDSKKENASSEKRETGPHKSKLHEKESLNAAIQNLLQLEDVSKGHQAFLGTFDLEEKRRSMSKGRSPSVKVDTLKRRKKTKKIAEPKPQIVEIPFCSHNQHPTGMDAGILPELEKDSNTNKMNTILTPDEQLGAEEILRELIEIRDNKKNDKNPVLDTMISIIQLSSTNVSLPSPATSGNGIQFKELFDFEVNFSESREAFAKLAGLGGPETTSKTVTVQELFPWSGAESGTGPYNRLKGNLL